MDITTDAELEQVAGGVTFTVGVIAAGSVIGDGCRGLRRSKAVGALTD